MFFIKNIFSTPKLKEHYEKTGIQPISLSALNELYTIGTHTLFFRNNKGFNSGFFSSETMTERMKALTPFADALRYLTMPHDNKIESVTELMGRTIRHAASIQQYFIPSASHLPIQNHINAYQAIINGAPFYSYDIEALGGQDAHGANILDAITELAYTEGNFAGGEVETAIGKTKHYFFGINQDVYAQLEREIKEPGFATATNRGQVIANRLAIYGHPDTVISGNQIIKEAEIGEGVPSVEQMLEGLKVLRKAGMLDESTRTKDGLTDKDRFIAEFVSKVNNPQTILTGHNIMNYDNIKLGAAGIDISKAQKFDTLTIIREASKYLTSEQLYQVAGDVSKGLKGKSSHTQENIIERILGAKTKGLQAHTASVDSALHSLIIGHPVMQNAVQRLNHPDAVPTALGELVAGRSIMLNKESSYGDYYGLSFLGLPSGELNAGNGYSFFRKKGLVENNFKPGIMKKDAVYVYGGSGTISLTGEDKKAMRMIDADYAQDALYYALYKPYGDSDSIQGSGTAIRLFKSKEHLQRFVNSQVHMGEINPATQEVTLPIEPNAKKRAEEALTLFNLSQGDTKQVSLQTWLDEKTFKSKYDRSSRQVRRFSYDHTAKMLDFIEKVDAYAQSKSIVQPIQNIVYNDRALSIRLANNERIPIEQSLKLITEVLGNNPKYNSVDNFLASTPFAYRNRELLQMVHTQVSDRFSDPIQRESAYQTVMSTLFDMVDEKQDLWLSKDDLNYIEVPFAKLKTNNRTGRLFSSQEQFQSEYMRINLNNTNAGINLINQLLEYKYQGAEKKLNAYNLDLQGKVVIKDLAKAMKIKNFKAESYDKAQEAADALIIKLKALKSKNPLYGVNKTTENVKLETGQLDIMKYLLNKGVNVEKTIEELIENAPVVRSLDKSDPRHLAEKVVKTFNQQLPQNYFYDFGFEKKHADYLTFMYERFQKEQIDFYSEVFKNFKSYDGLGLILDKDQFALTYGSKVYNMMDQLPMLRLHADMPYIKIGNMDVALHSFMQLHEKEGKFMLTTNFANSVKQAPIGYRSAKKRIEQGINNPAESIEYIFKRVNSFVRESAGVTSKNRMEQLRPFDVDTNDVRRYIPVLIQRGDIKVTPSERKIIERYADKNKTGVLGMIDGGGSASLNHVLNKYLDQAMAIIFNTSAYEGETIKDVAQSLTPYLSESRASQGIMSYGPTPDAFGEFGPGNRVTRFQNNFFSFDIKEAQSNLESLTVGTPKYHIDQNITSQFGYRKGVKRLQDFKQLDRVFSDQIVVKKLNIAPENFRYLIEKYFSKAPVDGYYNKQQLDKIQQRMKQYGLAEDESIVDARILENVFWQQNELQKVRALRNADNSFVEDANFKKMHKVLNYSLKEVDGKVKFSYGGQIERKRNEPLFKMHGYHNTENLTIASYDGYLKMGFYSGIENIMLKEEDINYLIKDMTLEEAQTYINQLNPYYYLDRKNKEPYTKLIAANTEKTKSRILTFKVGELDEELKDILPEHLIGSSDSFLEIKARAEALGLSDDIIRRIEREHYAIDIVRNQALGGDYAFITNPSRLKHKGIDTHLRELFPSIRQYYMDQGMNAREASSQIQKDFMGMGFDFDIADDGSMLLKNMDGARTIDFKGIKNVVKEKYKFLHPDLLEELVADETGVLGTTTMVNLARTKEHELTIATMPIERVDTYRNYMKQLQSTDNKIKAREALLLEIQGATDNNGINEEEWYEEYVALKEGIKKREEYNRTTIEAIQGSINLNEQMGAYHTQVISCNNDLDRVNKTIDNIKKELQKHRDIIDDQNVSDETRNDSNRKIKKLNKQLKESQKAKQRILSDKESATQIYLQALKQNTRNKREEHQVISALNYQTNNYVDNLQERLESQIKGLNYAKDILKNKSSKYSSAYRNKNHGIVIDELALMKLRNKRVSSKTYQALSRITSPENMSLLGIDLEDIADKPIFNTLLKDLVEIGMSQSQHGTLTKKDASDTIQEIYGTSSIGQSIFKIFEQSGLDKMSVEAAEARYALSRMDLAIGYNEGQKKIDYLKKAGFKEIDIREYQRSMDYDADFLMQGDSIFGSNLILNVNGEKVAVPYMPHSVYGNSVVQKQYESNILKLQNAVEELDLLDPSLDKEKVDQVQTSISQAIEDVKDSIHLLTSKNGTIAETITKSYYDTGIMAKSASYTSVRDADLRHAFYKGKRISQWMDEDVYINAAFTSRQVFEDMGFFSEGFKDQFKDGDVLFNEFVVKERITDEQLEQIYKKYGISGLGSRFPYIQEMSINAKQLYLSDDITDNTIKNLIGEQKGKSSDNDGDTEVFMPLKVKNSKGQFIDQFVEAALGRENETTKEFETAIGIDAVGALRFNMRNYQESAKLEASSQSIMKQAKVYDRMFFDGKLYGEQIENPYFREDFSIDEMRSKINELQVMMGSDFNLDAPDTVANFINELDDTYDKEGYKKAIVDNLAITGRNLASTAKIMKNSIGEANLMLRDFDQSAEILMNSGIITPEQQKSIAEMSYAIQQESISPKNAKAGDINIESISDFKRIVNAGYYNKKVEYDGEMLNPRDAMGAYLDNTIKAQYIEKYAGTENLDYKTQLGTLRYDIDQLDVSEEARQKLYKDARLEYAEKFYQESKDNILEMIDLMGTEEVREVTAYNRFLTKIDENAKYYNTPAARRGLTNFTSKKDTIMHLADDLENVYEDNDVENMINPNNPIFKHMMADPEQVKNVVEQTLAKRAVSEDALTDVMSLKSFKSGKALAGAAVAGIGAYMLLGAMGSSVTANTTNQAEQVETGDTLTDYGSDYNVEQMQSYTQNSGYVINVQARTDAKTAQRIAGQVNQSISQSLNANLNMTLNINETPLKQMQINKLIQDSLFRR